MQCINNNTTSAAFYTLYKGHEILKISVVSYYIVYCCRQIIDNMLVCKTKCKYVESILVFNCIIFSCLKHIQLQTCDSPALSVSRLHGCYESLEGGNTGDAVVDFSGCVVEAINLEKEAFYKDPKKQDQLFEDLLKVYDQGGIISCSIRVCALCEYVTSSALYFRDTDQLFL